jgi:hypothetical protein
LLGIGRRLVKPSIEWWRVGADPVVVAADVFRREANRWICIKAPPPFHLDVP